MQAMLRRRALRLLDDVSGPKGALLNAPGEVLAAVVRERSPRAASLIFTFTSGVDPRWTGQYTLRALLDARRRGFARGTFPPALIERALAHALDVLEQPPPLPSSWDVAEPPPRTDEKEPLRRWGREHGLEELLALPASSLTDQLPPGKPWLVHAFRQGGTHLATLRHRTASRIARGAPETHDEEMLEVIDGLLLDAARVRRLARAVLAGQPDLADLPPPEDEVLAGLHERLLELRRCLAEEHGLTLEPRLVEPTALMLEEDPPALVSYGAGGGHQVVLSSWRTRPLSLQSRDVDEERAPRVALDALETMIDLVREPAPEEERRLVDLVGRAPWQRLLGALEDAAPTKRQTGDDGVVVSWRLEPTWRGFEATPYLQKRKKGGGLTAGARMAPHRILEDDTLPLAPQDRPAATALLARRAEVEPSGAELEALAGHPRVFLADDTTTPLRVERVPLSLLVDEVPGGFKLGLGVGAARLDAREVSLALERGRVLATLSIVDGTVSVARVDRQLRSLVDTLGRVDAVIPGEAKDALLRAVHPFEGQLRVCLPRPLQGDVVEGASLPVVRLDPQASGALEVLVGVRPFEGAPLLVPGEGEVELTGIVEGRRVTAQRDLEEERENARALVDELPLPPHAESGPWRYHLAEPDEALDLLAALAPEDAPRTDLVLEWPEAKPRPRISRALGASLLRVEVEQKKDWLGLDGELDLGDERVRLALLLDGVRRGKRYVQVTEERFVALSKELRAKLRALADGASEVRGKVEVGLASVALLDDLERDGARVEGPRVWRELLERMRAAHEIEATPPKGVLAELRPYQREGFAWLKRLSTWGAGAVLADDMGLGKTLQAIALLVDRQDRGPQLVVAPTSVCFSWVREMERFAPGLRPRLYAGADRERHLVGLGPRDVVVTSWGLLLRDVEELKRTRFETFVMDEAQAIKNAATRRAKAAREIDAAWRLALTGTPLENHLGELWAIFQAAAPGLLGSWQQFKARFAVPIERHSDMRARRALSHLLRPFLLRRTKLEVAEDLPPRTEVVQLVELTEEERRAYDDVRLAILAKLEGEQDAVLEGDGRHQPDKRFEILSALTRLRLRACHPALDGDDEDHPSSKLKAVLRIAHDLKEGGHRALVFSQFTSHLSLVRRALEEQGFRTLYLDGSTPQAERARLVDRFQGGEGDLFLISLKAGGVGLNLTAADYVLLLDPWWNPAVEDQAADRTHRIGQTRPVTIYKLVARGTIEESILSLQADKRRLVDDVLEGSGGAGALSTKELVALIEQRGHRESAPVPAT